MTGSRNLANDPGLVRSLILEENLSSPHFWTILIPNYILKLILIPPCKYSSTPSSKKYLFTANGGQYKKPQLNAMKRAIDHRKPTPSEYI